MPSRERRPLPVLGIGALRRLGVHRIVAADLAAMLGVAHEDLSVLTRKARIRLLSGRTGRAYRVSDVLRRLDPTALATARRDARARGFQIRASKWTLAGYPRLVREFHRTRNGELTPWHVTYGSKVRIWWKCPKGPDHEWRAQARDRTVKATGCPCCTGQKVSVTNSLATRAPLLARQWHPTLNGALSPGDVPAGTHRRIWWKCRAGPDHEWQSPPKARLRLTGCPFCINQRVSVTNSLATKAPALAHEWHPSKNDGLSPRDVVARSGRRIWWRCRKDREHEWRATPSDRLGGHGCPFCARRRPTAWTSLAAMRPGLAREWHPSRNGRLRPADVLTGSDSAVWWKCPRGRDHEWKASVRHRIKFPRCPFCLGRVASVTNSVAALRPDLARQWHRTRNGRVRPEDVRVASKRVFWWQCPVAPDHAWQCSPDVRRRTGCPFCAGTRFSPSHSLAALHPDVARWWHPTRNGRLGPTQVRVSHDRPIWWLCPVAPDHEWRVRPVARRGCPFCAGHRFAVSMSLAALRPDLARQWHPTRNGGLHPHRIRQSDPRRVWWRCSRSHEWQAMPLGRSKSKAAGCPRCSQADRRARSRAVLAPRP